MNKCWLSGLSCRTGWVRLSYQQVEMMSTRDWKTLGDIQLNRYVIFWPLERSKTQGWMRSRAAGRPIKYNFFFEWRSMIRFNVGFSWKKNWSGSVNCKTCVQLETTYHILFQCPLASFLWTIFRTDLGWLKSPSSMESLFIEVLDQVKQGLRGVMLFSCVGALWMLRNDVVFNSKVLAFPMAVIHKTIM